MAVLPISPSFLAVMVVSAFAIPLIFVWWIRNTPRFGREPMRAVLHVFGWGALPSAVIALVIEWLSLGAAMQIEPLYQFLSSRFSDPVTVFSILVLAPLVEEAAKALGVRTARREVHTSTDGLVYGAAAGLGFSAMENLLYGLTAWVTLSQQGLDPSASLVVIAVRSFSSSLLHASATATVGYGMAKGWLTNRRTAYAPFYLLAVLIHASFNFLTGLGQLYPGSLGGLVDYVGFFAAIAFAVIAITVVRFKLATRRPLVAR